MNSLTRWLILVSVLAVGCNSKPAPSTAKNAEDGDAPATQKSVQSKIIPVKRDVKEVVGNWAVVFTLQQNDNYRWMLNFAKGDDGKTVGTFIDTSRDKDENDKPQITETEVHGNKVRFVFKNASGSFDFVGVFQDGFIRGTTRMNVTELILTRLLPTDETSLEEFLSTGLPPGSDVLQAKLKSKETKPEELLAVAADFRTSPIAQDIYSMVLQAYGQQKTEESKFRELIDPYLKSAQLWGERWEARVELNIAVVLINTRIKSNEALAHLDSAEKKFGEDLATMKSAIDGYREAAHVNLWTVDLTNPDSTEEVKTKAYNELAVVIKRQPFNAEILYALAVHAQKTGQSEKAMEYLTDICSLPLLEAIIIRNRAGQPPDTIPGEMLKKLWIEKNGKEDGYIEFLTQTHHQKIDAYLAEIQAKAPATASTESGNRTVLIELFTSLMSPTSIAAELAVNAVHRALPDPKVIIIRYHQNLPPPDGLANQDSEERGAFYEIAATPVIVLDGMKTDNRFYSGLIQAAPQAYEILRRLIDHQLSETTEASVKLNAELKDGQLSVSAVVTGIPEERLQSCRLRLAIVENQVKTYLPYSSNGIQTHEYVVRELLGGSNGIPPKKGELKYSTSFPISDLQKHVSDYLSRFEAGRRMTLPPEMKPEVKGPFSLVAWVQSGTFDEKTRSKLVLQSAIIPITSDLPPAATSVQESKPKEEPSPAAVEPKTEPTNAAVSSGESSDSTPPAPELPE